MPAPWYRQMRCGCPAHPGPASALTLEPGGEVGEVTKAEAPAPQKRDLTEPMADMLDWLMHYDFREDLECEKEGGPLRPLGGEKGPFSPLGGDSTADWPEEQDDVCNEFIHEESTREETETSRDLVLLQMPRGSTSPHTEPGRVLHHKTKAELEADGAVPKFPPKRQHLGGPQKAIVSPLKTAGHVPGTPPPKGGDAQGRSPHCADGDGEGGKTACSPLQAIAAANAGQDGKPASRDFFEDEEEEWEMRKRYSGPVGRLVAYNEGDNPKDDIVLRGGGLHHIVVAGIREGGPAAKVGVRAGDRLVSINGKRGFSGQLASAVQDGLRSPAIMVFIGFVGKLQAEVRLARVDETAGLPVRQKSVLGLEGARFQLCEEKVFDVGASLFLSIPTADDGGKEKQAKEPAVPVFELQRCEATSVLRCALRKMKAVPHPPSVKGQDVQDLKAAAEKAQVVQQVATGTSAPMPSARGSEASSARREDGSASFRKAFPTEASEQGAEPPADSSTLRV